MTKVLKIMQNHRHNYFEPNIYIGNGKNISIGQYSQINENVFIQGAKIGANVMIAPNVSILSKGHNFSDVDTPMIMQGKTEEVLPIIEDNVWIGRNVVIMPGVHIGAGSIIGAGAIVTKNIMNNSIMGGVPAKLIKSRK